MNVKRKTYKTYTREFKLAAIRMMESSERIIKVIKGVLYLNPQLITFVQMYLAGRERMQRVLGFKPAGQIIPSPFLFFAERYLRP